MATYRCYAVFRKGSRIHTFGKPRKGPYKWVAAKDKDRAVMLFRQSGWDKPRKNEWLEKIVATPFKEDVAMRRQGMKELPFPGLDGT